MLPRIFLMIAVMTQLSGCIIIPRAQVAERIDFNYLGMPTTPPIDFSYLPPNHPAMSYDDMLCCYRCQA